MLHLKKKKKKKKKKNTCRYHYQNLNDKIYSSWGIEQDIPILVILGHFLLFYTPKKPKNQNFEKGKNLLEISLFYTCLPKITIIWCMVLEIRSETDKNFCHFGPFSALLPPPLPLMVPKSKILKKNEKKYLKILSFYTYINTINEVVENRATQDTF